MRGWYIFLFLLSASVAADVQQYRVEQPYEISLRQPWALVALPDDSFVVTEKHGALVWLQDDKKAIRQQVALPDLYSEGQGGFLDIALTQDFALSNKVMLTYTRGTADNNQLVVASAKLSNGQLSDITQILAVTPTKDTPVHFGGRLAVLDDGTWLVSTGDGFDYREQAQKLTSQLGKILHFREDGSAVQAPPFSNAPFIYSLGHRNTQGLVTVNGKVIAHEHGPAGGDEINVIKAGYNYGWPVVTLGDDYSGARISPFREYPGMTPPLHNWTPSVAPSGMIHYTASRFTQLTGQLLITTLKEKTLLSADISKAPPQVTPVFTRISQRLRDVNVSSDGAIMLLTDGAKATVLSVVPSSSDSP